jgi:hypothetical protein
MCALNAHIALGSQKHLLEGTQGCGRLRFTATIRFDGHERLLERQGRPRLARSTLLNLTCLPVGEALARTRAPLAGLHFGRVTVP